MAKKEVSKKAQIIGHTEVHIRRITTTTDGAISVTFDFGPQETELMKELLDLKALEETLFVTLTKT